MAVRDRTEKETKHFRVSYNRSHTTKMNDQQSAADGSASDSQFTGPPACRLVRGLGVGCEGGRREGGGGRWAEGGREGVGGHAVRYGLAGPCVTVMYLIALVIMRHVHHNVCPSHTDVQADVGTRRTLFLL